MSTGQKYHYSIKSGFLSTVFVYGFQPYGIYLINLHFCMPRSRRQNDSMLALFTSFCQLYLPHICFEPFRRLHCDRNCLNSPLLETQSAFDSKPVSLAFIQKYAPSYLLEHFVTTQTKYISFPYMLFKRLTFDLRPWKTHAPFDCNEVVDYVIRHVYLVNYRACNLFCNYCENIVFKNMR